MAKPELIEDENLKECLQSRMLFFNKILQKLNCDPERLKIILYSLDIAINFKVPLEKDNDLFHYAHVLDYFLANKNTLKFLFKESDILVTKRGTIKGYKMTLYELCLDYLTKRNDVKSPFNKSTSELRIGLKEVIEIHSKIVAELECSTDRLTLVTDNLDIAIDFIPPLQIYDSLKVYARDLEYLLTCTAGKRFLRGSQYRLTTNYGIIQDGK